jgi:hypothetical protein
VLLQTCAAGPSQHTAEKEQIALGGDADNHETPIFTGEPEPRPITREYLPTSELLSPHPATPNGRDTYNLSRTQKE